MASISPLCLFLTGQTCPVFLATAYLPKNVPFYTTQQKDGLFSGLHAGFLFSGKQIVT